MQNGKDLKSRSYSKSHSQSNLQSHLISKSESNENDEEATEKGQETDGNETQLLHRQRSNSTPISPNLSDAKQNKNGRNDNNGNENENDISGMNLHQSLQLGNSGNHVDGKTSSAQPPSPKQKQQHQESRENKVSKARKKQPTTPNSASLNNKNFENRYQTNFESKSKSKSNKIDDVLASHKANAKTKESKQGKEVKSTKATKENGKEASEMNGTMIPHQSVHTGGSPPKAKTKAKIALKPAPPQMGRGTFLFSIFCCFI